ncbi:2Fe-2S iron-sulfur cluster-binding protein [Microbulbifer taiwanensis]|uniref:2Fe-2S iron-sulfur cluster-binding protein n=1 Tax=Microbulbifer taiwanensis TaxID=986746 RepID=A0ABW1YNL2_9GAMM|nr:2Fe-2S iron-sulfur cluster-binding protein [Microbulbifer taiwanensis]
MPTILVTDLAGESSPVDVDSGQSLMEALRDNGFDDIEAICGGCCSCASCHVYLKGDWFERLGPRGEDEDMLVSSVDAFRDNSRLSCQIQVTEELEGLQIQIAEQEC